MCINDFLASGEIAGILSDEDKDAVINSIRSEAKSMGYSDTNDNCWKYFIDKIRKTLRVSYFDRYTIQCIFALIYVH